MKSVHPSYVTYEQFYCFRARARVCALQRLTTRATIVSTAETCDSTHNGLKSDSGGDDCVFVVKTSYDVISRDSILQRLVLMTCTRLSTDYLHIDPETDSPLPQNLLDLSQTSPQRQSDESKSTKIKKNNVSAPVYSLMLFKHLAGSVKKDFSQTYFLNRSVTSHSKIRSLKYTFVV